MTRKIESNSTLVVLHGDEMAQIAFWQIIEKFIKKRVEINIFEVDLSAENRIRTNGEVVTTAIDALKAYKVGVKNAGITVNSKQLDELIEKLNRQEGLNLQKETLPKLATKSPNGTIRKGIHGNITREDIPFINLRSIKPEWKNRNIDVVTMDYGGLLNSFNRVCQFSGILKLSFIDSKGKSQVLHTRQIQKGDPYLLATNCSKKVYQWAEDLFNRALSEKRDVYVCTKDTVIPGYDGVMKKTIEDLYFTKYEKKFKEAGIKYEYGLIDAQAAKMIVNPPKDALWGIPDNSTGRKFYKLVEELKIHGIPQRVHQVSISRMSAGGGDQYGSFNAPASDNGILTITIGQRILHSRDVSKGDPIILMSNNPVYIKQWVQQSFAEAAKKDQEIYFGLKREYMHYDNLFSDIINEVRDELAEGGNTPPPVMTMTPSKQLVKMICDPPRNARYAALNLDGDIFSDITAALGGSLATASSIIMSHEGIMLFEAPHGTASDLYEKYLKTKGKEAIFNPSALIYAFANALEVIAENENNQNLKNYSDHLKEALIGTVAKGIITGDIKGKTLEPEKEKIVDLFGFMDAVEEQLLKIMKKK